MNPRLLLRVLAGACLATCLAACTQITQDLSAAEAAPSWSSNEAPYRTFSEGTIEGCNGHRIAYQRWTHNEGAYATLIFATGRTEYTDKYHHLIPMVERRIELIFFDHVGQGRSEGIRAHVNSVDEEHACDLRQVVHELSDPNLPRFLLSHSMGGLAAIRAIQQEPDLVRAAAFSAPMWGLRFPDSVTPESARGIAQTMVDAGLSENPMQPPGPIGTCEEAKLTRDCALYDAFKDDPVTHIGASTWGAGLAFLDGISAMHADTANVQTPLFVLTASEDVYVDNDAHAAVCEAINGHQDGLCQQQRFDNTWHELLNEVDRAEYLESILIFFDQHLPQDGRM